MGLENVKSEKVNENENKKKTKMLNELQEYILQKPANTKVKTQSDMKAWNAI